MQYKSIFLLLVLFVCQYVAWAQKPFAEGTIYYKIKMIPDDPEFKPGIFVLTVKGDQVKKEMKLNGYEYIMILNCTSNKAYSFQNRNGKKYAIELKMDDLEREQERFKDFVMKYERNENKKIAGCAVYSGDVVYKDGSRGIVSYSKEWKPRFANTFERFPGAEFLPLEFSYKDVSGLSMRFEAEKVEPGPVENAVFRIPPDYKIISYHEYKELLR